MKPDDIELRSGFFTKALFLRGQASGQVERRLGYRTGRLSEGWWLLFLLEMPGPEDFEFRGYSQMSGGVAGGHLPNPSDPRNSEQVLRGRGYDVARLKRDIIQTTFRLSGHERLAKVVPARAAFGDNDYPPGSGVPQWTLVRPKRFRVAAFVPAGETYRGHYL